MLNQFDKYKFYFKLKKYIFHQTKIKYLKYFVGCNGIKINPKITSLIFE